MIKKEITEKVLHDAEKKRSEMPDNFNNSILSGKGTLSGCIGEVVVYNYLKERIEDTELIHDYNYDVMSGGAKIEVKTKKCSSAPKPYYECSVSNYNSTQACDYYFFTRVTNDDCYLLGYLPREEFIAKADFKKKGDTDSNMVGGKAFTFHCDCYNIPISKLKTIDNFYGEMIDHK